MWPHYVMAGFCLLGVGSCLHGSVTESLRANRIACLGQAIAWGLCAVMLMGWL